MDQERDAMHTYAYDAEMAGTTPDERTWATFMHIVGAASYAVIGPFAPLAVLVMWLMKKETSGYLDDHGREALNFSISILIWSLLFGLFSIVTLGIGVVIVIPASILGLVLVVVWTLRAAMAANRGEFYRYPMCFRLICS